ncbi:hypothetical protein NL676_038875 [Syzygium grande]|nr:hypothetical protein NL676_038875 [Syzygium grande]
MSLSPFFSTVQNQAFSFPPKPLTLALDRCLITQLDGGHLRGATSHLDLMSRDVSNPDLLTFYLLLKSCIHSCALASPSLARSQREPNSMVLNSPINLYSKFIDWAEAERVFTDMDNKRDLGSADWVSARKVFEEMSERNVVAWAYEDDLIYSVGLSKESC